MVNIDQVKIRARISVVGAFDVETPYILSFNVRRARGQISTFDASIKTDYSSINIVGDEVKIWAGEDSASERIFTGIIRSAKITPCFDDPSYVIMSLSGEDILSVLRGKRYTRRCKAKKLTWAEITGVTKKTLKSGKFKYKHEPVGFFTYGDVKEASPSFNTSTMSIVGDIYNSIEKASSNDKLEEPPVIVTIISTGEGD